MRSILFTTCDTVAEAKRRLNPGEKRAFVKGSVGRGGVRIWLDEGRTSKRSYGRKPKKSYGKSRGRYSRSY